MALWWFCGGSQGERGFQQFSVLRYRPTGLHLGSIIHVSEGLGARAPPGTVGLGQDPRGLGLLNAWAEGDRRVGIFFALLLFLGEVLLRTCRLLVGMDAIFLWEGAGMMR